MQLRKLLFLALALALVSEQTVRCQGYGEEEDEPYGEGAYGGGGGGGYGGDEGMPPPPPPEETQELLTLDDFEAFVDNTDASVIAAFTDKEIIDPKAVMPEGWDIEEDGEWEAPMIENPTFTSFNSISSSNYGYRFAYTTAPEVLAKLKCKKSGLFLYRSPKFISVKDGDRPRERYPSDTFSDSAVSNWLAAKAQPLVGMYSHSSKDRYKGPVLVIFMYLDFEKNAQSVSYVLKRARKVAARQKGKLSIAVAALSDMSYELSDYGLTSTKPTADILMGIRDGNTYYSGTVFLTESGTSSAFSGNSLSLLSDAYLEGKLTPYVKPEEPPPSDDDTPSEDDESMEADGEEKDEM